MTGSRRKAYARLVFFREFLRHPDQVGSVVPSSRFLERRLVEIAAVERARLVVELGPGTGGTTAAILRALPSEGRLLAVEINPQFAARLHAVGDSRLIVHAGNAVDLGDALACRGLRDPDVVLSGIPFSTMSAAVGRRILVGAWRALAPGGRFVAYQFRGSVGILGGDILGAPEVTVEMRNAPPVRVYCWRKPGEGETKPV
jgi:phospholipid N-methyltransferase